MSTKLYSRSHKEGLPPGTLVYTGKKRTVPPKITVIEYDRENFIEKTGTQLAECLPTEKIAETIWVNVEGLNNVELVRQIGAHFGLHPLVLEDILNVNQRSKVEEFKDYVFVVLKKIIWHEKQKTFRVEQVSIVFGKGFLLSFQEQESNLYEPTQQRLRNGQGRLREQGSDYLAYVLCDTIVDHYFFVLEKIGTRLERIEDLIIVSPDQRHAKMLYRLKRQMLIFRKAIWPLREAVSHLLRVDVNLITPFTLVYLRDVYDHTVQVLDTIETFRDMLAGLLDVYLSSLTNRMNEVMKVLTVVATIFIPLTFIASVYGMNFTNMPELHWKYSYYVVLSVMAIVAMGMIIYFRRKKWL